MRKPGQPCPRPGRFPQGADPHPARHADDRQGAGFSERDAGGRGQRRRGPARARFPLGGADVSAAVAGGRAGPAAVRTAAGCWCRRSRRSIRASPWRRLTITRASSPPRWRIAGSTTIRRTSGWPASSSAAATRRRPPPSPTAGRRLPADAANDGRAVAAGSAPAGTGRGAGVPAEGLLSLSLPVAVAQSRRRCTKCLRAVLPAQRPPAGVEFTLDVDPFNML